MCTGKNLCTHFLKKHIFFTNFCQTQILCKNKKLQKNSKKWSIFAKKRQICVILGRHVQIFVQICVRDYKILKKFRKKWVFISRKVIFCCFSGASYNLRNLVDFWEIRKTLSPPFWRIQTYTKSMFFLVIFSTFRAYCCVLCPKF